jgi:diguanylate cyclase (GGDEF)-like protein
MSRPTGPNDPGTHPRALIVAVLAVFVLTVLAAGSYVAWLIEAVDGESLERQAGRIRHAIGRQLEVINRDQQSVAIWSAALEALRTQDYDWLQTNVGSWTYDYYGHREAYILNADDSVAYASSVGVRMGPSAYDAGATVLKPLVDKVRAAAKSGVGASPHAASDYVLINGVPSIAGVMTMVTDDGEPDVAPGEEPILVSISVLDFAYETNLIDKYQMQQGRFTVLPQDPRMSTLPVVNSQGRILAFYEWLAERPGKEILDRALPAVITAVIVLGGLTIGLLLRLWHSSIELDNKRRDAERLAREDMLTGLPNRLSMEQQFKLMQRQSGPGADALWLFMLDLDRFKQVNDTFGHHAGDDLIRAVAARIGEVIAPDDILARLGGDEFAIVMRRDEASAAAIGARILTAISRPFRVQGVEIYAGVSIGAVMAGPGPQGWTDLSRKADIALYEAKANGRNRLVIYEETMDEDVQGRHQIEAELREALRADDGQLWLAFQPLYCGADLHLHGAEALVRWTHPRLGLVPPARFIPIAESAGLIERLGRLVFRDACAIGARWPGMTIAVNVSPAQLRNADFVPWVFELLASTGMRPADLELEITEGILLDDEQSTATAIRQLRNAGIRIALDDFGTGYSSLNYLKRYPVDRIKIDRSFVSPLAYGSKANAIVEAMITLSHALDMEVTAEGVESIEQRDILVALRCNTLQGYLLSAPISAERMERMFQGEAALARDVAVPLLAAQ